MNIGKHIFFFIGALVMSAALYVYADRTVAAYFYAYPQGAFKQFFRIITQLGQAEWVMVPALLGILWVWKKQKNAVLRNSLIKNRILYFVAVNVVAGAVNWVLKFTAGRARPKLFFKELVYGFEWFELKAKFWSFPSGHTVTVVGSAVALGLLFPRWRYVFWFIGAVLAFSRVVVVEHYPSDVLFAGYLAAVIALLTHQYFIKKGWL